MEKLIITLAPTGSIPKTKDNPNVPVTPEQIVECALRCEDEGAAIIHIHARDKEENASDEPEFFQQVVDRLEGRTNLIINISTGGRAGVGLESRTKRLEAGCEMASLTTGSVNFPRSAYINAPDLVDGLAQKMKELGIKPEIEVFDLSMINNAVSLLDRDLADAPLHFNFVMGLKGAMPARIEHLVHLLGFLPEGGTWLVSGVGAAQLPLSIHAVLMGGHVRVGLEDNIYYRKGELATNEMLVQRIVSLSRELGREVATPDEARKILGLK